MAVDLSHVGEAIVSQMIDSMRLRFLDLCQLSERADRLLLADRFQSVVFANVGLTPYGGVSFDGASCVDLVVLIQEKLGVPFELKLGETRLTKRRIGEWLSGCKLSHRGKRFSGNMMSILERKFPAAVPADTLRARVGDREVALTKEWFVIARSRVLRRWEGVARPAFSANVRLLGFETIVHGFGGQECFNAMVHDVLNFDYYSEWIMTAESIGANGLEKASRLPLSSPLDEK